MQVFIKHHCLILPNPHASKSYGVADSRLAGTGMVI